MTMKMLIAAVALATAAPAVAQSAPADHHAGHGTSPAEANAQASHAQHGQHAGHEGCCGKGADGKMACKHDKAAAKKMDCCKEHAAGHAPTVGHDAH
jgi:hypothetical protein